VRQANDPLQVDHRTRGRILHVARDHGLAETTYAAWCRGVALTCEFLGVADVIPFANLFLLPDREAFDRFVGHLTPTPTAKGRVGQAQGHDLYLLSPSAYPSDASGALLGPDGRFDPAMYDRLVVHEAVHMVEEHLSPPGAMEVRPAWWSEGLAVLISEQYRLDHDVLEHLRADLAGGTLPTLESMTGAHAYTWAWTIIDFLRRERGMAWIADRIVNGCSEDVLDLPARESAPFARAWREYAPEAAQAVLAAARTR
jgi:hypothetical protein